MNSDSLNQSVHKMEKKNVQCCYTKAINTDLDLRLTDRCIALETAVFFFFKQKNTDIFLISPWKCVVVPIRCF